MSRVTRVARLEINTLNTGQRLRDTKNNNVGIIIAIIGTSLSIQWDTGKTDLWSNTNNLAKIDEGEVIPTVPDPNDTDPNDTDPNANDPNVIAPNAIAPKVTAPNAIAPKVTAPKVTAPKVTAPKVTAPKVTAHHH